MFEGIQKIFTYGRNSRHNFAELKFVKDCGFASSVQANHKDPHLLFAKEPLEEGGKEIPHPASLSMPLSGYYDHSECAASENTQDHI